jgi:hypothetical protein
MFKRDGFEENTFEGEYQNGPAAGGNIEFWISGKRKGYSNC